MTKVEYIPGDLVMTNGVPLGTAKDVVYRVTSSDPSKTLELNDGTVLKGVVCLENIEGSEFGEKGYLSGDCCAWVKDIVPMVGDKICQIHFDICVGIEFKEVDELKKTERGDKGYGSTDEK